MSRKKTQPVESEWSYQVNADEIHVSALRLKISPDAAARSRLIKRLNVLSIDDLEADLKLQRRQGNTIHVEGSFRAQITQSCIVTMAPVKTTLKERFEAWFADREQALSFVKAKQDKKIKKGHVEVPMLEEHEDPEPIESGQIDLGELVTQHVSLAIDPYPRSPEVVDEKIPQEADEEASNKRLDNPFAALKDWKNRIGQDDH